MFFECWQHWKHHVTLFVPVVSCRDRVHSSRAAGCSILSVFWPQGSKQISVLWFEWCWFVNLVWNWQLENIYNIQSISGWPMGHNWFLAKRFGSLLCSLELSPIVQFLVNIMFTVIWTKSLFITSAAICPPWDYRCSMRVIWVTMGCADRITSMQHSFQWHLSMIFAA